MATIERDKNGNLVLNDPEAMGIVIAVEKHNCKLTLEANADRVLHFRQRAYDRGDRNDYTVIVVANVDDRNGEQLAAVLMPGHDWQQYRNRGETPFARGLASREFVQEFLNMIDEQASEKLREFIGLAVVVVDRGVAEIF